MNDYFGMFLDAGFMDHWPDILLAALIASFGGLVGCIAWFLKRDISGMDKRHERAENKFEKVDDDLADHETRITVIERTKR